MQTDLPGRRADAERPGQVELVAVCRRDLGKAHAFAAEHGGGCAAYGSTEELLADPKVRAVANHLNSRINRM